MRRAIQVIEGVGHQETESALNQFHSYDHPYFGQIFLALMLKIVGFPNSVGSLDTNLATIEMLDFVPRVMMGLLAIIDTFLVYKIAERRYNTNVAIVASVLFAVMPMTWLLRMVLLDTILLPFLLASILLAVYYNSPGKEYKKQTYNTSLIMLSGILMGLAIFTKITSITVFPLIIYLILVSNNNRNLRNLAFWFIPVVLIPAIWPIYAIMYGQFDEWVGGVSWQTSRISSPLFDPQESVFEIDPVLVGLGITGIIFATIRREFFFIIWLLPYILFLAWIGYSQYIHLVALLPILCLAAAILIESVSVRLKRLAVSQSITSMVTNSQISKMTDFFDTYKPQEAKIYPTDHDVKNHNFIVRFIFSRTSFLITLAISIFGLVNTIILISTDVNSSFFTGYVSLINHLPDTADSDEDDDNKVTIIGPRRWGIYYYWISKYIFNKDLEFFDFKDIVSPETKNIITIQEGRRNSNLYQDLGIVPTLLGKVENMARQYDFQVYPYTNMKYNQIPSIQMRSNY